MRRNNLINFRNVIYGLSRDFGFRIDLYRPTEITNYKTGAKVTTRIKYHIRRAVMLPNEFFRDFKYAVALGAINQNLQAGGLIDTSQRRMFVEKRELPVGFMIQVTDYIIFNHDRYEIVKAQEMEVADFWVLDISQTKGQPTNEVHEELVRDKLSINSVLTMS
jgi:hypothetical protein